MFFMDLMESKEELCQEAEQLGRGFGNLDRWLIDNAVCFGARTYRSAYRSGADSVLSDRNCDLYIRPRVSIFIERDRNLRELLDRDDMAGISCRVFSSSGLDSVRTWGKGIYEPFRMLNTWDHALVLAAGYRKYAGMDTVVRPLVEDGACFVRLPGGKLVPWSGFYFIVTSDFPFKEWCSRIGIEPRSYAYYRFRSFFYICRLEKSRGPERSVVSVLRKRDEDSISNLDVPYAYFEEQFQAFHDVFEEEAEEFIARYWRPGDEIF